MFAFYSVPLALVFAAFSNAQAFNCVVTIPPNPLTAAGLATPYKVTGCNQIDFANQGTFVEAAILDPATGAIQIYHPLVINQDNNKVGVDFIAPITPTLPANAVVGIWFGSNAQTVQLVGTTQGCVNGLGNSLFGQFAYCNGPAFFTAAQAAVAAGLLTIPPPGQSTKVSHSKHLLVLTELPCTSTSQSADIYPSLRLRLCKHAQHFEISESSTWIKATMLTPHTYSSMGNNWLRTQQPMLRRIRRTLRVCWSFLSVGGVVLNINFSTLKWFRQCVGQQLHFACHGLWLFHYFIHHSS